jgi:hypothetical protein
MAWLQTGQFLERRVCFEAAGSLEVFLIGLIAMALALTNVR